MPIARPHVRTVDSDARLPREHDWLAIGLLVSMGAVLLLAVFLAARRMFGAMLAPLTPLPLLTTAIVLLTWVWSLRLLCHPHSDRHNPPSSPPNALLAYSHFAEWAPFASLVLVAFASSYPGARFLDWLIWLPTVAAAWVAPHKINWNHKQKPILRLHESAQSAKHESSERILQQLTRFRTTDGRDAMRGTIMSEFAAGQRVATLYVGFCPPFTRLPDIETECDDAEISVSLVQALHNGAQFEIRLAQPAKHPTSATVEFFAAESSSP